MELIKEGSSAEISDNPATVTAKSADLFGKFGKREGINEQEQSQLIDAWQSNTDVTRRLLFISVLIGTIAFLTAITALVLPLVMMKSLAFNTSSTFSTDHGALQSRWTYSTLCIDNFPRNLGLKTRIIGSISVAGNRPLYTLPQIANLIMEKT